MISNEGRRFGLLVSRARGRAVFAVAVAVALAVEAEAATAKSGPLLSPSRAGARAVPAVESPSSWVIAHNPRPSGGGFGGVSCPTNTMCLAVGAQGRRSFGTFAEKWNGKAWKIKPTPNPSGFTSNHFNAVSCSSAKFCMAVGSSFSKPDTYQTLAEAWNGSTWTIEPTRPPGRLDSVSCTSATNCIAGGVTSYSQALAEHWDGSAWRVIWFEGSTIDDLTGISCTQATSCTAVGGFGLAAQWNGSDWATDETFPPGHNAQYGFNAVSCTQASSCVAVGTYTGGGGQFAFSSTWNGTTWTDEKVPRRTGTNGDYLTGITCFSTGSCLAAGFTLSNAVYATLLDRWNGSGWKILRSPPGDYRINSSSCVSKSHCAAVGSGSFIMQTRGGG